MFGCYRITLYTWTSRIRKLLVSHSTANIVPIERDHMLLSTASLFSSFASVLIPRSCLSRTSHIASFLLSSVFFDIFSAFFINVSSLCQYRKDKYSGTSLSGHLSKKGTSLKWALCGPPDWFSIRTNLSYKGTSELWEWALFFSPYNTFKPLLYGHMWLMFQSVHTFFITCRPLLFFEWE